MRRIFLVFLDGPLPNTVSGLEKAIYELERRFPWDIRILCDSESRPENRSPQNYLRDIAGKYLVAEPTAIIVGLLSRGDLTLENGSTRVLGRAWPEHSIAIVSLSQFHPHDHALALRRLILHEVGHLYGLVHCTAEECRMRPASNAIELISREVDDDFCDTCHNILLHSHL